MCVLGRRTCQITWIWSSKNWASQWRCWQLNLGSLEDHQGFLTPKPFFKSPHLQVTFIFKTIILLHMYFNNMYVCWVCACLLPAEVKKAVLAPLGLELQTTVSQLVGAEHQPQSSTRSAKALMYRVIPPAPLTQVTLKSKVSRWFWDKPPWLTWTHPIHCRTAVRDHFLDLAKPLLFSQTPCTVTAKHLPLTLLLYAPSTGKQKNV